MPVGTIFCNSTGTPGKSCVSGWQRRRTGRNMFGRGMEVGQDGQNRTKAERYIPACGLKKPGGIGRTQYSSDAQAGRCVVVAFWKNYRGWGVISPVAGEPAARDRCRGCHTGADTEKSVFRHVLSAASDQGAGTPFEASEPIRPVREFIIACGLAAYGKRRSSDQTK